MDRLSQALEDDALVPYFQPIYSYKTNRIEKYECLVRLISDGSVHTPDKFLDVAKKTNYTRS